MSFSSLSKSVLRRAKIFGGAILALGVVGFCASPLERSAWRDSRERLGGGVSVDALAQSAGAGIALGTLGGFRTALADFSWLRAFHFWTKRDAVSCWKYCELSLTLAPEQEFFLENAMNYVAFDFPVWEIRKRGRGAQLSLAVRKEIQKNAMARALEILENATEKNGGSARLFVLAAQIVLLKTEMIFGLPDYAKAAAYYRRACDFPDAPWYAFSTYAGLVSHYVPAEKRAAENFLRERRSAASSPRERQIFDEILAENFPENP